MVAAEKLTRKDFQSDQEVRWCPGCGDYAILATVQKFMPSLGIPKENVVVISGIGCSSRFPYYMETYGFHTIHGRAPALATGVKVANPDLSVWVVTGDGDGLSIGAGHLLHALRRNIDINILLFNNRIYGLTKGQYSPTSEQGKKTKSTPMGSIDAPLNPVAVALGANASFVARTIDRDAKHLAQMLERAAQHKGTTIIEILQNCPVFNDGAWESVTDKSTKAQNVLAIEHGKPLLFGPEKKHGIRLDTKNFEPEVVEIGKNGVTEADIVVHDEQQRSGVVTQMLAHMPAPPTFPIPVGVLKAVDRPVYEVEVDQQIETAQKLKGQGSIMDLLHSGETWTVS